MTGDGRRHVLAAVLNDLHHRGVGDGLIAGVDGLNGLPEAIEATFPQTGCSPAPNADQALIELERFEVERGGR